MPVRSTSARTTATARSSERTSRKTPFSAWARPIGVRQASTITAVFIDRIPILIHHRDTEIEEQKISNKSSRFDQCNLSIVIAILKWPFCNLQIYFSVSSVSSVVHS